MTCRRKNKISKSWFGQQSCTVAEKKIKIHHFVCVGHDIWKKKKRFTELINLWRYQFIPSWPCCTNLFPQPQFNKIKIREWISKTCPRFNENKEKIIKTWPWNTLVGKNCFHLWPHYNFTLIKLYYIFFLLPHVMYEAPYNMILGTSWFFSNSTGLLNHTNNNCKLVIIRVGDFILICIKHTL